MRSAAAHALAVAFLSTVLAADSLGVLPPGRPAPAIIDNTTHIDANDLDMFVTNHGSFAYDLFTGNAGLVFPTGSGKTAVFAAGIWVGARVAGSTRLAVGEYAQEFVPGPMAGGTFQPDDPTFRVYTLTPGDTMSAHWQSWCCGAARDQGAPLDSLGKPLLLGDQTLWTVYNDADPTIHTNQAGETAPLGVQVSQLTYAYAEPGALDNTIFLRFVLTNGGAATFESTYVSLWSDPDLGGASDDFVGCDTTLSLGYVYNSSNSDFVYGSTPPALGFVLLHGPLADGAERFVELTAFSKYIGGTDPANATETYNYMHGSNADGTQIIDPGTNMPTTFVLTGDPVTGTGWVDAFPADRRMMLTCGPFTMAPGEVRTIACAIVAAQGADRLASITLLRQYVSDVHAFAAAQNRAPVIPALGAFSTEEGHTLEFLVPATDVDGDSLAVTATLLPPGAAFTDRRFTWTPSVGQAGDHVALFRAADPFGAPDTEAVAITVLPMTSVDSTGRRPPAVAPASFGVHPNVASRGATVSFSLPAGGEVEAVVFDAGGARVRVLADSRYDPGEHDLRWDLRDAAGRLVPAGVYVVRLASGGSIRSARVCVLR